jgi:serine/threonine protein phosphatase 1
MLTYAIGDVHGCLDKLVRLLARCRQHGGGEPRRLVFVGDYIDRGPDSRGVIETVLALQRAQEVICLRGNHEAMVMDALETNDHTLWLRNGGGDTLANYGVTRAAELPAAHLDWIAALRPTFDDGRRLFVHAGVNPALPLDRQDERDLVWIREPFLSSRRDYGRLIVHGHTPLTTGVPDHRANRLNIDTAAVFGGPLTAAVFADDRTEPIAFLTDEP